MQHARTHARTHTQQLPQGFEQNNCDKSAKGEDTEIYIDSFNFQISKKNLASRKSLHGL